MNPLQELVDTITRLAMGLMSLATVNEVRYQASRRSVLVNVTLQPSGVIANARIGMSYVGAGRGMHWSIREGQECLVAFPGGDRQAGVILAMLPNGVDLVSDQASDGVNAMDGDDGDDWWIRVRGDVEIAIDGDLVLHVTGDETEHVEGDVDRLIDGSRTEEVGVSDQVTVGVNRDALVGGTDTGTAGVARVRTAPVHTMIGAQYNVQASAVPATLAGVMTAAIWALIKTHTHSGGGSGTSTVLSTAPDAVALTQILKAE